MSEQSNVEVQCIVTTFDEETYVAGKTYQVDPAILARYPDSFRAADWKDPAADDQVLAQKAQEDLAARTQAQYENARDHAVLMEAGSDLERARQRKELEDQLKKQREENRKVDQAGVESTGWQPKPPPKAEPPKEPAPTVRTSGPSHTLPRAERLKHTK